MRLLSSKAIAAIAVAMVASGIVLGWQSRKMNDCEPCGPTMPVSARLLPTAEPPVAHRNETNDQNQGQAATEEDATQTEDLAYNKYFDGKVLAASIWAQDPSMITDCGLGLAEGERALERPNNTGLKSEQILMMAAKVASKNGDMKELKRLESLADKTKNAVLAKFIAAAKAVAGKSRAPLQVDITQVRAEDLIMAGKMRRDIAIMELIGDKEAMSELSANVAGADLPAALKAEVQGDLKAGMEATKDIKDTDLALHEPVAKLLVRYNDLGRDSNEASQKQSVAAGGWRVYYGKKIDNWEYVKAIGAIAAAWSTGGASLKIYLDNLVSEVASEAVRSVGGADGLTKDLVNQAILRAISGKSILQRGKVGVKGGLVTWNKWEWISGPKYDCGVKCDTCKKYGISYPCNCSSKLCDGPRVKVPLPNQHQFYVAFRLGS